MQLEANHKTKHIHSTDILNVCSWLRKMPCMFILKIPQRNCTIHEMGPNNHDFEWVFPNMCFLENGEEARRERGEVFLTQGTAQLPCDERKVKVSGRQQKQTNWKTSA